MVQTYNEFKVVLENGKIVKKEQTKKGSVRISAETARIMNEHTHSKFIHYELAEEKKSKRDELKAKAKELGIEFHNNIKTEKLIELIEKQK